MSSEKRQIDKQSLKEILFNPSPEFRTSVEETLTRLEGQREPAPVNYDGSENPYNSSPTYKQSE